MGNPPSPAQTAMMETIERFRGCLLGMAAGDALGTTLEFCSPGSFTPIEDMVGGGPFHLKPGEWTDDTSMGLCLAESLIECQGFDPRDQLLKLLPIRHVLSLRSHDQLAVTLPRWVPSGASAGCNSVFPLKQTRKVQVMLPPPCDTNPCFALYRGTPGPRHSSRRVAYVIIQDSSLVVGFLPARPTATPNDGWWPGRCPH